MTWQAPEADDQITGYKYHNPIPGWLVMGAWIWLIIFAIIGMINFWELVGMMFIALLLGAMVTGMMKSLATNRYRGKP